MSTSIVLHLGYPEGTEEPILSSDRSVAALDIMSNLNNIDTALQTALPDSMATQVGDLKVDYSRHLAMLRYEGSRLLKALARVSGLEVRYDKYTGADISANTNPYYVTNFW